MLLGLTGLRDAAAEADCFAPTVYRGNPYRADSNKPDRRIDMLLVRDGAAAGVRSLRVTRAFDELFEHEGRSIACSNHAGLLAELELAPGVGAALAPPDPHAVALASQLLRQGRKLARGHRREGRTLAGLGAGAALVAGAGLRSAPLTRRGFLRGAVQTAALAAIAPTLGYSFVSEVVAPDQLRAFDALSDELARLGAPARDEGPLTA
jgi:hypothetical protein